MAKQATGKDPFGGNSEPVAVVNHPLADVQKGLVLAEVEQEVLKVRIKAADDSMGRLIEISDSMVERKMEEHPEIIQLRQELLLPARSNQQPRSRDGAKRKEPAYSQRVQDIRRYGEEPSASCRRSSAAKSARIMQLEATEKRNEQIAALENRVGEPSG